MTYLLNGRKHCTWILYPYYADNDPRRRGRIHKRGALTSQRARSLSGNRNRSASRDNEASSHTDTDTQVRDTGKGKEQKVQVRD